MVSIALSNRHVIPCFNATMALQSWLRPGLLAYIVGAHAEALKPHAIRLQMERNALLDEFALKYPAAVPEGAGFIDGDGKAHVIGSPHPLAGQHVTFESNGQTVTRFKSKEAGTVFVEREAELMDAKTSIVVDERLTLAHMHKLDTERLATPRANGPAGAAETAVDFGALSVLIAAPLAHDGNGVAVPAVVPGMPALVP
jgi:hypothetical protein